MGAHSKLPLGTIWELTLAAPLEAFLSSSMSSHEELPMRLLCS